MVHCFIFFIYENSNNKEEDNIDKKTLVRKSFKKVNLLTLLCICICYMFLYDLFVYVWMYVYARVCVCVCVCVCVYTLTGHFIRNTLLVLGWTLFCL